MSNPYNDAVTEAGNWNGPAGELAAFVREESTKTLEAYRAQPNFVSQDANQEGDTARGGYAHRQLFELIQNCTDALAQFSDGGRIFQMIGRGLRGIKNGGNDRCLILNVLDNIDNFQGALAFSDLDWLWAKG